MVGHLRRAYCWKPDQDDPDLRHLVSPIALKEVPVRSRQKVQFALEVGALACETCPVQGLQGGAA